MGVEKCKQPICLVFNTSLGQVSFNGAWKFIWRIEIIYFLEAIQDFKRIISRSFDLCNTLCFTTYRQRSGKKVLGITESCVYFS